MTRTPVVLAMALGALGCTPRSATAERPVQASSGGSLEHAEVPATEQREPRTVSVSGGLPTDIIKRIVQQAKPDFLACYERRTNPSAAGVVVVRFTIVADGTVRGASDHQSDLPDEGVVRCVLHVFEGLAFPQPEPSDVIVVYPITLPPSAR